MLRRDHQLKADLGRIYSFSLGLRMDEDGTYRRSDVMACRIYARQTLEDIARSQDDPFNYRLLDLWLDVFQRPWDQPTNLHQLLEDLAREVGSGELKVYLEYDPNAEHLLQSASKSEVLPQDRGDRSETAAIRTRKSGEGVTNPGSTDKQPRLAADGGIPEELESVEISEDENDVDLESTDSVQFDNFCDSVEEFSAQDELAVEAFSLFKNKEWGALESLFQDHELNGGWPPNRGAINSLEVTLKPGAEIDRYGGFIDKETGQFRDKGKFTAKAGEPFEDRALPDNTKDKDYKKYRVAKRIPNIDASKAIPWFGKSGKGVQYELPMSVEDLVTKGYLEEIA